MITIQTHYPGNLRTESVHLRSATKIITDAPIDNNGKGESFSPTDLLATSLGCCMLTIIGMAADTQGFTIDGVSLDIVKVMAANPRRVSEIQITFHFQDVVYTEKQQDVIKRAALTCPVALSLHPDINQMVNFNFREK
jgi:uncharacterized OsmC-like protein